MPSPWQCGQIDDSANTEYVVGDVTFEINGWTNPVLGTYDITSEKLNGSALRFPSVDIPVGSTILTAYVSVRALADISTTTVNARLTGNLEVNPPIFDDSALWRDRRGTLVGGATNNYITTHQVDWNSIAAWTADTWYNSPDISAILQEIINQAGWASGNPVAIFLDDHNGRSTQTTGVYRMMYGYIDNAASAPKLYATWSTGVIVATRAIPLGFIHGQ